jgi:hypothetical protein
VQKTLTNHLYEFPRSWIGPLFFYGRIRRLSSPKIQKHGHGFIAGPSSAVPCGPDSIHRIAKVCNDDRPIIALGARSAVAARLMDASIVWPAISPEMPGRAIAPRKSTVIARRGAGEPRRHSKILPAKKIRTDGSESLHSASTFSSP